MHFLAKAALCASLGYAASASAAVIKPSSATASSEFNSAFAPVHTINGSGLTGSGTDPDEAHATYDFSNHWTTAAGTNPLNQWIQWFFDTPQTLGAAYIWNHRSNGIAANSGYEPTTFDLNFYGAGNAVLLSMDEVALAPDTATAQQIDFALLNGVTSVRFDVEGTQSSTTYTGLAEVAFDTESFVTAIPEPKTWAMLLAGFFAVGSALRRRNAGFARLKAT